MKRDNKAIDIRIKELGLTKEHVANQFKYAPATISRIIAGLKGYTSKDTIKKIHEYLDKCKTRKDIDFK
jgi:plasmid maintenance system antidote protein VapI